MPRLPGGYSKSFQSADDCLLRVLSKNRSCQIETRSCCEQCIFQNTLSKATVQITSTPLPSGPNRSQNWWGEGLPPPSFRNTYSSSPTTSTQFRPQPPPKPSRQVPQQVGGISKIGSNEQFQTHKHPQVDDLEQRISKLKDEPKEPPSMEELEERLAKLRGCDVELIRNPKSVSIRYFFVLKEIRQTVTAYAVSPVWFSVFNCFLLKFRERV